MTRHERFGFRHVQGLIVHLYTECPGGNMVATAKRDSVRTDDPFAIQDLAVCEWCRARELELNPRPSTAGAG